MITAVSNSSTGAITGANNSDFLQKLFDRLDGDGDGKVTQDEFTSAMQKRFGQAGETEATSKAAEAFKQTDTDGDGAVSVSEFKTAFEKMRASGAAAGAGAPPPPPPPPPAGGSAGAEAEEVFDVLDTNKDGKVSLEELAAGLEKRQSETAGDAGDTDDAAMAALTKVFEGLDTDGDGAISAAEFAAMMEKMKAAPKPEEASTYAIDGQAAGNTSSGAVLSARV